jgi:hypothetical protein
MGFANAYLKKHANPGKLISSAPSENLRYIVAIPAYNESGLIQSLDSFLHSALPKKDIEILCLINWPENVSNTIKEYNHRIYSETLLWAMKNSKHELQIHCIKLPDMPKKIAGVGLARKILMDEAVTRFNTINNREGIIISFDADSECKKNFFTALEEHYDSYPNISGCNIYFEHKTEELKFSQAALAGITFYELHLRYYLQALRRAGHPNVFHTLGSSFSVKASDYCSQGGMNKRQAGEDFYFLQKLFDLGSFSECNKTAVYPSSRPSDRVPFGTGPVINEYLKNKTELTSYHPQLFNLLKLFIEKIPDFYIVHNSKDIILSLPYLLREFLIEQDFDQKLMEIKKNSSGMASFKKRFFRWFNMFRMLKFLNYGKKEYPDIPISIAALMLANEIRDIDLKKTDSFKLLDFYRALERDF